MLTHAERNTDQPPGTVADSSVGGIPKHAARGVVTRGIRMLLGSDSVGRANSEEGAVSSTSSAFRDLIHHSVLYALGDLLARLTSIVLLPFYTRHLHPSDYAIIALLDFIASIVAVFLGSGLTTAVTRYHFDPAQKRSASVWYTGVALLIATSSLLALSLWTLRNPLARIMLGPDLPAGPRYLTITLITLWLNTLNQFPNTYIRVRKWSLLFVAYSLATLLVNVGLNYYFIAVRGAGVEGLLLGNCVTAVLTTLAGYVLFCLKCRPISLPDRTLVKPLLRFAYPLVLTSLMSIVMHQGDRYLLRIFAPMKELGLYSLAYQIGQSINTTLLLAFSAIWTTVLYEVAATPRRAATFARIFEYFFFVLTLFMLGCSLLARPLLHHLVAPDYFPAAELIPVICLGYLFFSLHEHFKVPVMLGSRSLPLVPTYAVGAAANIVLNLVLIPLFGVYGAAASTVLTFILFSVTGLLRYRRIEAYPYPFRRCLLALAAAIALFLYHRFVAVPYLPSVVAYGTSLGFCAVATWQLAKSLLRFSYAEGRPAAADQVTP